MNKLANRSMIYKQVRQTTQAADGKSSLLSPLDHNPARSQRAAHSVLCTYVLDTKHLKPPLRETLILSKFLFSKISCNFVSCGEKPPSCSLPWLGTAGPGAFAGPPLGLLRSGLRAPQLPRRTAGRPGHRCAHTDRESTAPFRGHVSPHNYVHCN